jgi:hypothetical protein
MNGICFGQCSPVGFVTNDVDPSDSAITVLVGRWDRPVIAS